MRKNTFSFKEAIDLMISEFKLKPNIQETRIRASWNTVMGNMIANHTKKISFKKGKLYLEIDSAPLKQELSYSKEKIKELFNKELGEQAINDVLIY